MNAILFLSISVFFLAISVICSGIYSHGIRKELHRIKNDNDEWIEYLKKEILHSQMKTDEFGMIQPESFIKAGNIQTGNNYYLHAIANALFMMVKNGRK